MTSDITYITKGLPPILSGEQVRTVLHISKRRCAWLLQNGHIVCTISPKRSRRYAVKREDLIDYIKRARKHPEDYEAPLRTVLGSEISKETAYKLPLRFPTVTPSRLRRMVRQGVRHRSRCTDHPRCHSHHRLRRYHHRPLDRPRPYQNRANPVR